MWLDWHICILVFVFLLFGGIPIRAIVDMCGFPIIACRVGTFQRGYFRDQWCSSFISPVCLRALFTINLLRGQLVSMSTSTALVVISKSITKQSRQSGNAEKTNNKTHSRLWNRSMSKCSPPLSRCNTFDLWFTFLWTPQITGSGGQRVHILYLSKCVNTTM